MLSQIDEQNYNVARDKVDNLIRHHSKEINQYLQIIAKYRSQIMLHLIQEWRDAHRMRIQKFDSVVRWEVIHDRVAEACADYIRYVFYYRFANNLQNNIQFRKILSFETHFFCKRQVFQKCNFKNQKGLSEEDSAIMFYENPVAHFLSYRILKELSIRLNLADAEARISALKNFIQLTRSQISNFFMNYDLSDGNYPRLDDLRIYIDERENTKWGEVITHIEKKEYGQPSAF